MRKIRKVICLHCCQAHGLDIAYGMPGLDLAEMADQTAARSSCADRTAPDDDSNFADNM